MTRAFLFWIIMLLWLLFGLYWHWPIGPGGAAYGPIGLNLLAFVLFALLGWQVFGSPVKG